MEHRNSLAPVCLQVDVRTILKWKVKTVLFRAPPKRRLPLCSGVALTITTAVRALAELWGWGGLLYTRTGQSARRGCIATACVAGQCLHYRPGDCSGALKGWACGLSPVGNYSSGMQGPAIATVLSGTSDVNINGSDSGRWVSCTRCLSPCWHFIPTGFVTASQRPELNSVRRISLLFDVRFLCF
jgi:hypothetical protein